MTAAEDRTVTVDGERPPVGSEDRDPAPEAISGIGSLRDGLDREYQAMGTGEAGAGVGGGGATSSDVEWDAGTDERGQDVDETAGGAMTNEQDFTEEAEPTS